LSEIDAFFEENRPQLERALASAEKELEDLDGRRLELVRQINRARTALGENENHVSAKPLTLHEAIAVILKKSGNDWTHVKDLAQAVNEQGLYTKRDGSPVQSNQIHARTKNYTQLFEKEGPMVRLRPDA